MKALVVDDDLALADVISFTLRRAGFEVMLAYDGQMALEQWQSDLPDLIILDLNLPKISGFEVCQQIRANSDVPILILSVRDDEDDVITGLKFGADDYITKPFSPRQLIARAEAILRRVHQKNTQDNSVQIGNFKFIKCRNEIWLNNSFLAHLTKLECELMEVFIRNQGNVLTTEMLIDSVWGPGAGDRAMLKQLVYRLRRKIEVNPSQPVYLETVNGIGYTLNVDINHPEFSEVA